MHPFWKKIRMYFQNYRLFLAINDGFCYAADSLTPFVFCLLSGYLWFSAAPATSTRIWVATRAISPSTKARTHRSTSVLNRTSRAVSSGTSASQRTGWTRRQASTESSFYSHVLKPFIWFHILMTMWHLTTSKLLFSWEDRRSFNGKHMS